MADKLGFPQIPSTVWWGVREVIRRTPNITLNETTVAVQLNVQPAAARQYVAELKRVNIIDEECKATEIAKKWRLPETYSEAVKTLLPLVYPQELLDIAEPAPENRETIRRWFEAQGLGSGSANNKAATYILIGTSEPQDAVAPLRKNGDKPQKAKQQTTKKEEKAKNDIKVKPRTNPPSKSTSVSLDHGININLQIHISADATGEQIEKIFSSMRVHLLNE